MLLIKSFYYGGSQIKFDFSDIRPKGAMLVTSGGKAPGPQPLKECIVKIQGILNQKENGDKLTTLEVHDIVCHIADAVLAGGIRRAALISLFSADDDSMISSKHGNWWESNPQRGRSNNSAVLVRSKVTEDFFFELWEKINTVSKLQLIEDYLNINKNSEYFVDYFEKYRIFLTKSTLNNFTKDILNFKF